MAIKAVFFDIGGVVVSGDMGTFPEIVAPIFKCQPHDVQREVQRLLPQLETGELESAAFWKAVGESLWRQGLGLPTEVELAHQLWNQILRANVHLDLSVLHLCWQLARRGLIVGALSNVIADHAVELEAMGAYQPFNPLVLSCREGIRKPDRAIYKLALKRAGVRPRQVLFIDDLEENLVAAKRAGMCTHLYRGIEGLREALGGYGLG